MSNAGSDPEDPMGVISYVSGFLEEHGDLPEGWHFQELPTFDPPPGLIVPEGMVCISPPGSETVFFVHPGSLVRADFGELDLGIVSERSDH
jgi:hypothetical protein